MYMALLCEESSTNISGSNSNLCKNCELKVKCTQTGSCELLLGHSG